MFGNKGRTLFFFLVMLQSFNNSNHSHHKHFAFINTPCLRSRLRPVRTTFYFFTHGYMLLQVKKRSSVRPNTTSGINFRKKKANHGKSRISLHRGKEHWERNFSEMLPSGYHGQSEAFFQRVSYKRYSNQGASITQEDDRRVC